VNLLNVQDLTISTRRRRLVERVSFEIGPGQNLGLIGESGSGKTLTALAIMGLLPENLVAEGSIRLGNRDLLGAPEQSLCQIRGNSISMVFQEPMTALNPVLRIGKQIAEALEIHQGMSRSEARTRVVELLSDVGIEAPEARSRSFPHQLSGGQRQRAMIAMALACGPELLIADEPTTALDVTVQAQVLAVLRRRVATTDTALLLITHDLPVVATMCEKVVVMADGQVVERGPTRRVFDEPETEHTRILVSSVPPLSATSGPPPPPPLADLGDTPETEPFVEVRGVTKAFRLPRRRLTEAAATFRAVDDAHFEVYRGETLGIVGESGSGKTTLARMIVGLLSPDEGEISVGGSAVTTKGSSISRTAQMVFQDPMGSLDPRMTVGDAIAEPLRSLRIPGDQNRRVAELLEAVAMPDDSASRYPHEFSGGQRQRIAIARALAPNPRLLVADEPVSALDMSVRTRTLELLAELKRAFGLTMIFISHDLSVVHEICDRVLVMQRGKIVELGSATRVFTDPESSYTRELLAAIPRLDGTLSLGNLREGGI